MIRVVFSVAVLLLCGCSPYHFSANTLLVADWSQTLDIARNPDQHGESNPVLGKSPSVGRVNAYFISSLIAYNSVYYLLPRNHRDKLAGTISALQLYVVASNYHAGVKFDF